MGGSILGTLQGQLGADVTANGNVFTLSLTKGTWLVMVTAYAEVTSTIGSATLSPSGAGVTFSGPAFANVGLSSSSAAAMLPIVFLATVASTSSASVVATLSNAKIAAGSGYVAVKIA